MKRVFLFFTILFYFPLLWAHNPNNCTLTITQTNNNQWEGQLNFSTHGLIALIQTSTKHKDFKLDTSHKSYVILKNYILQHYKITINKSNLVQFSNFRIYPNQHCTEIIFDFKEIPVRPELWELDVNFKTHHPLNKFLIFVIKDHKKHFLLQKQAHFIFLFKDNHMVKLS